MDPLAVIVLLLALIGLSAAVTLVVRLALAWTPLGAAFLRSVRARATEPAPASHARAPGVTGGDPFVTLSTGGNAWATQDLDGRQHAQVRVRRGYEPSTILARADQPLRVIFRREEADPRSERVLFPDLGTETALPPFTNVGVDLPANDAGIYAFTSPLGALQGRLVILPTAISSGDSTKGTT